jgi:pilus assembly protein Flp/PilA
VGSKGRRSSCAWSASPLVRSTRGASLTEYLLIVGLVALIALGGFRIFGSSVDGKTAQHTEAVAALIGTPGAPGAAALPGGAGTGSGALSTGDPSTASQGGKSWGQKLWDFGKGFVSQGVDTVTGLIDIVRDPAGTAQGLWYAVTNPVQTAGAIKDAVVAAWNEDPEGFLGRVAFEAVTLPFAVGKLSKLKAANAVKAANAADDASDAAKVADAATDAAKAAEAADDATDASKAATAAGAVDEVDDARRAADAAIAAARAEGRPVRLSLGGEGEVPGAIDINNMEGLLRSTDSMGTKNPVVKTDMTKMPIDPNVADEIVGNAVPMHASFAPGVAAESFRVLKPGGTIKLFSRTGGADIWLPYLRDAGFVDVKRVAGFATGRKP